LWNQIAIKIKEFNSIPKVKLKIPRTKRSPTIKTQISETKTTFSETKRHAENKTTFQVRIAKLLTSNGIPKLKRKICLWKSVGFLSDRL